MRWARRRQRRRPSARDNREKYIFVTGYGAVGETPAEAAGQCEEIDGVIYFCYWLWCGCQLRQSGRGQCEEMDERNKKGHHNRCEKMIYVKKYYGKGNNR